MRLYEKLDDCQRRAVRVGIRRKCACIFFEQGVGKTHPMVSIMEEVMDENFAAFGVVLLTNLHTTWTTLLGKEVPTLSVYHDWDEFKSAPCPKLFLINYESVNKKLKAKMSKFSWTLGFFDESQRLKARGTNASRLGAAIKSCEYRFCLSGTPTDGDEIHLFGQLRFVVPSLYGNDRSAWRRFDERFLKPTGYMGYDRKFRPEMLPIFLEEVAPYILRVEAGDVLNLPPCTSWLEPVDMLGDQRSTYIKMERDMVVKLMEQAKAKSKITGRPVRASAGLKITQMVKLQQICGGYLVDDDGDIHEFGSCKMRRLKYLLRRQAKHPTVIFCKYTEELQAIERLVIRMGLSYGMIHGKVKDKKNDKARTRVIEKFQRGQFDVMICQTRTGGVGVDLYAAQTGIFYSTTFSWIDFDQCRKRIHRRGQLNPTTLFFIYVKNTIDEDIYSIILSKRSVSKKIFNNMRKRNRTNG